MCVCVLLHIPLPSEDYIYLKFIYNKGVSCTTELHKYLIEDFFVNNEPQWIVVRFKIDRHYG